MRNQRLIHLWILQRNCEKSQLFRPKWRGSTGILMTKRIAFEKLKKYQKVICLVLLWATVRGICLELFSATLTVGLILFFYWDYITTPPEIRKQLAAARFRRGSDSLDPSNPCGFNNSASPLYHQHNSKSIFDK